MSVEGLAGHLAERYEIKITGLSDLDQGVVRVGRSDGPDWVARVFAAERPFDAVVGDAVILRALQDGGFPAERCADDEPVSLWDGRGVLVTEFVHGERPEGKGHTFAVLGALLGRLHSRPATTMRAGGAWHHASPVGGPREEVAAMLARLDAARSDDPHFSTVYRQLADVDDCADLPHAFVHPDFVPANAIASTEGGLVMVDWAGSGRGPRLWSLAFLLYAAGARDMRLVDAAYSRYSQHITLEPEELARLDSAIRGRPLVIDCWSYLAGRRSIKEVADGARRVARLADSIVDRITTPPA
jgi:Ser/Thr protein kinase RdoA (MazF antagonist)